MPFSNTLLSILTMVMSVNSLAVKENQHGTPQGRPGQLEHAPRPDAGKVVEKRTKEFTFDDQKFNASEDEPYYIIESGKTGSTAAHKESALNKLKSD